MIEVRTCARLHLGLLDPSGECGRLHGSIGLAVDQPRLWLSAEASDNLIVEGLEQERVRTYARRFIERYGAPGGARLNLVSGIPAHVGLGSGTQIALAVGTALARLAGLRLGIDEIAMVAGRGTRSGIGIATFRYGGFVLDGGHRIAEAGALRETPLPEQKQIPPIVFRRAVPRDWFFIVCIPGKDQGISGERESRAFSRLPEADPDLVGKVSRLLLMKMLPALLERDIAGFGQALTAIQQMVGDRFAPVQGGRYSNPKSGKIIEYMLAHGAVGAGQSSWGPAVYGLVQGRKPAQALQKSIQTLLEAMGGGQAFCVQPQNRGATITDGNSSLAKNRDRSF